jgi:hypothetical protein
VKRSRFGASGAEIVCALDAFGLFWTALNFTIRRHPTHSAVFEVTLDTLRERSYTTRRWFVCSQSHF